MVPRAMPLADPAPYVTIGRPVSTRSKIAVMTRKAANPYHVARRRSIPADDAHPTAPARKARPATVYSAIGRGTVGVGRCACARPRASETLEQHNREQGEEREEQRLLDRDPGRHARDDPVRARGEPAPARADDVECEEHDEHDRDGSQQAEADDAGKEPAGEEEDAGE